MHVIAPGKLGCETPGACDRGDSGCWVSQVAARWVVPALAISLLTFVSCVRADTNAPLRAQLLWTHQTQFAGYYLAQTRTFQREPYEEIAVLGSLLLYLLLKIAKYYEHSP